MLTVSLHNIKLHANIGLYPEEKITGNDFEVDVDVMINLTEEKAFPFIDYVIIGELVSKAFQEEGELLETFVQKIHQRIKSTFSGAHKVKVVIRKLNPPLPISVGYSQVSYEA